MPVKNETSMRFIDEVRTISPWFFVIAGVKFVAIVALMIVISATHKNAHPSPIVLIPFGIVAGALLACYILLIGYVNRDAGRRNMSRVLWTLIAILVPNGLGIVLYFVLRKPRTSHCPQCTALVEPGFGFCPRCRHRLSPVCPQCQRSVHGGDKFCPYCGRDLDLGTGIPPASVPVANQG